MDDIFVCCCFHHDIAPSGSVAGIIQGADLGKGLLFKVQLHILNSHVAPPWEQDGGEEKKGVRATGHR